MGMDNAILAWIYYLLGAAGLIAVWWRLSANFLWPELQKLSRLVVVVLLIFPFSIGDGYSSMAPALLMVLMETVFEGGEAFFRVGPTLLGAVFLSVLVAALWEWRQRKHLIQQAREALLNQEHDELLAESNKASIS